MNDQVTRRAAISGLFSAGVAAAQITGRPTNLDEHGDMMPSGMDMASDRLLVARAGSAGQVQPVLTRSGGNLRHGTYLSETILTPAAIVKTPPRKLFSVQLPGDARGLEAQPLVVPRVTTASDGATHDVLLSATMSNHVYAHDAQDGTPLWMVRLGNPVLGTSQIDGWKINEHWGVLSTGVVDGSTLVVVSWSSPDGTAAKASHHLHAIDIRSGAQPRPPLALTQPGAIQRKQRASLTLVDKTLLIPWGTIQETSAGAHGFITAIDIEKWAVTDELNLTATGSGAGVWMAGQGLAADSAGALYCLTGNGSYDGKRDFGECFLKLTLRAGKLEVAKSWSPFRDADRGHGGGWDDMDLGSGGVVVLPDLGLVAGAGKDGILYVLDAASFTLKTDPIWFTFFPGFGIDTTPADVKQLNSTFGTNKSHHMHSTPIYWNAKLYCWGENSNLRVGAIDKSGKWKFLARSAEVASPYAPVPPGGMPGGFMALSANGNRDGVIWCVVPDGDANRTVTTGRIFAFDAQTWGDKLPDGDTSLRRLWMSDPHHVFNKFMPPVVSGGKLYMATYDASVDVWGL